MSIEFEFVHEEPHAAAWIPTVDVCERPSELVIIVEVPGVDRRDLQVTWCHGVLTISGCKRRHSSEKGTARYICVERTYGQFKRQIEINLPIEHAAAGAQLRDGLLKIRLPKAEIKREAVVIPVR